MYALVRRYEGITNVKEAVRHVNEGLVPLISQHPGFIDYILVDSGGGGAIAISIFLNQADAEESSWIASDWVRENLATLVPKPPQITAGEVIAYKE
jgi:hypothetical protein